MTPAGSPPPVVADARGGWKEMIRHGRTGYLCDTEEHFAHYTSRLARDEAHRQQMAHEARRVLEEELADPASIRAGWREVFASVHDRAK